MTEYCSQLNGFAKRQWKRWIPKVSCDVVNKKEEEALSASVGDRPLTLEEMSGLYIVCTIPLLLVLIIQPLLLRWKPWDTLKCCKRGEKARKYDDECGKDSGRLEAMESRMASMDGQLQIIAAQLPAMQPATLVKGAGSPPRPQRGQDDKARP